MNRRDLALLGVVGAILMSVLIAVVTIKSREGLGIAVATSGPSTELTVTLPSDKADLLYDLIAPSSIRVVVSKKPNGLKFRGSLGETKALMEFADLMTVTEELDEQDPATFLEEKRANAVVKSTYKLRRSHGRRLRKILAADDFPVWVSGSSGRVTVEATPEDQDVIRRVYMILEGERF
jgi:hypothetical protein